MTEPSHSPILSFQVVWDDSPDLIEVEVRVATGGWAGVTRGYTAPAFLAQDARGLLDWSRRPIDEYRFEAGSDTGIGWACLRWYAVDRAGHLACHAQLATPGGERPESRWRLSVEFPVVPYAVELFAHRLIAMADTLAGEAVLPVET